jgi:peptidoglycan/LPS O-acetylase OafA/YrhL
MIKDGKRIFSMDVIRGVAILLVLLHHMPKVQAPMDSFLSQMVKVIQGVGWVGVDLFFVLSGYLISRLLFREFDQTGNVQVMRFWLRRGFKIWPSYFLAYGLMVFSWVWSAFYFGVGREEAAWLLKSFPVNAIFIQNYLPWYWRWPHSWSLAIEEHFYTLLPLGLLWLHRYRWTGGVHSPFERLYRIIPLICVAILAGRLFTLFVWPAPDLAEAWHATYYPTHLRADGLLLGVLVGYATHTGHPLARRLGQMGGLMITLSVAAIALVYFLPREESRFTISVGFTLLAITFAGLVNAAHYSPDTGSRGAAWQSGIFRLLAWLGVYSYTIYLAHAAIPRVVGYRHFVDALQGLLGVSIWTEQGVFLVCAILGGFILSHLIERPALRWRSKLVPSGS